jgi:hypothetical protein
MVFWIKRTARILGIITFFVVFFIGLDPGRPFDPQVVAMAFLKGILGAILFWFAGFILGDIVFKGLVSDVHTDDSDAIDGGLLQRIHDEKKRNDPDAVLIKETPKVEKKKEKAKEKEKKKADVKK